MATPSVRLSSLAPLASTNQPTNQSMYVQCPCHPVRWEIFTSSEWGGGGARNGQDHNVFFRFGHSRTGVTRYMFSYTFYLSLPTPPALVLFCRVLFFFFFFLAIPHSIAGCRQSFPLWTGASSVKDFNLAQVRTSSILQLVLRGDRFDLQRAFFSEAADQTRPKNQASKKVP